MTKRLKPRKQRLFPGLMVFLWLSAAATGWAEVTARLSQATITDQETAQLIFEFNNVQPDSPPKLPAIDGLSITYAGQSSSTSLKIMNGRRSLTETISHTFNIRPERQGTFIIPALEHSIKGESFSNPALQLTVVEQDPNLYREYAFLTLNVPKDTIYVGEVVPINVVLAYKSASDIQFPTLSNEGFTFATFPKDPKQGSIGSGNNRYNAYMFQTTATAVKSGDLEIGPASCGLSLVFSRNQRSRDFFGGFFNTTTKPVTLKTDAKKVSVLPIPEDTKPDHFGTAIGQFQWQVAITQTNVTVGDPITIKIDITGSGNLESMTLPAPVGLDEFQVYEPKSNFSAANHLRNEGTKSFEQVIIPQNSDITQIPELTFSYFDPEQKRYETLSHPPTPLMVRPSTNQSYQPSVLATSDPNNQNPDSGRSIDELAHIKTRVGRVQNDQRPLLHKPWFLALHAIPLLAFTATIGIRLKVNHLDNNPRLRRRREAQSMIKAGFRDLQSLTKSGESDAFFAATFRILQLQIGDLLDRPAPSITAEAIAELFHNDESELRRRIQTLFDRCDQARYAPEQSTTERESIVKNLETIVSELQNRG